MQYIILIGDERLTLNSIKSIKHYDSINSYDVLEINGRYCVDYGKDYIFYDYDDSIINDYVDAQLLKIPFDSPHFVIMTYVSKERIKKLALR